MKIGAKEVRLRELRERSAVPRHVEMMLEDGAPLECVKLPGEPRPVATPLPIKEPPSMLKVHTASPAPVEAETEETVMRTAKSSKTKAKGKARTAVKGKTKAKGSAPAKGIRPGSKLETIVGMLKRKEGCTAAEVLAATGWPSVSMPQQARAAGLTLKTEKEGRTTRYRAA